MSCDMLFVKAKENGTQKDTASLIHHASWHVWTDQSKQDLENKEKSRENDKKHQSRC